MKIPPIEEKIYFSIRDDIAENIFPLTNKYKDSLNLFLTGLLDVTAFISGFCFDFENYDHKEMKQNIMQTFESFIDFEFENRINKEKNKCHTEMNSDD